jgi:hypothetical protein
MRARKQEIQLDKQERITREAFIRKKQEYEGKVCKGGNIPQLNGEHMRHTKNALSESFKNVINPTITTTLSKDDDWDEWPAFECADRNQCTASENTLFKQLDATRNAFMEKRNGIRSSRQRLKKQRKL